MTTTADLKAHAQDVVKKLEHVSGNSGRIHHAANIRCIIISSIRCIDRGSDERENHKAMLQRAVDRAHKFFIDVATDIMRRNK